MGPALSHKPSRGPWHSQRDVGLIQAIFSVVCGLSDIMCSYSSSLQKMVQDHESHLVIICLASFTPEHVSPLLVFHDLDALERTGLLSGFGASAWPDPGCAWGGALMLPLQAWHLSVGSRWGPLGFLTEAHFTLLIGPLWGHTPRLWTYSVSSSTFIRNFSTYADVLILYSMGHNPSPLILFRCSG